LHLLIVSGEEQPKGDHMKNVFMLLAIALLLGGCATAKKTYTSEGKDGYSIQCSGTAGNWGMCYEKAGELCGQKGYEVLAKSGDQGMSISANQLGLYGGSVINRNMIVKYKNTQYSLWRSIYEKETNLQYDDSAKLVGIGVQVDNHGTINQIIDGSPAHSAGLKLGDKIINIDGQSTVNNKSQIEEKLTGDVGTYANVAVLRNNKKVYFGVKREGYIDE
jgi:hypothetical protein